MGTDIAGWIEAKDTFDIKKIWQPVIDLNWLYSTRDYDAFGCFFGIRNFANFRPLAEGRGLPPDISAEVKRKAQKYDDLFGHTWLNWKEIKQIDWEEKSEQIDKRIHRYKRNEQGIYYLAGKATWEREFAERVGYDQCIDDQEQEWDLGDVIYRREYMQRKDVKKQWDIIFNVLEHLAAQFGDENARLIVWFDS